MVDQYYMSIATDRGKAGIFGLQQVLLDFQRDLMAQFGSEQDWSAS